MELIAQLHVLVPPLAFKGPDPGGPPVTVSVRKQFQNLIQIVRDGVDQRVSIDRMPLLDKNNVYPQISHIPIPNLSLNGRRHEKNIKTGILRILGRGAVIDRILGISGPQHGRQACYDILQCENRRNASLTRFPSSARATVRYFPVAFCLIYFPLT